MTDNKKQDEQISVEHDMCPAGILARFAYALFVRNHFRDKDPASLFGKSSSAVVEMFLNIMKSFKTGTRESLYATTICDIVSKLALHTNLEKIEYDKKMADAHLNAKNGRISITNKEKLTYLLGGGIRLLLMACAIGGVGIVLTVVVLFILSLFGITIPIHEGDFSRNATWGSITLILAFTILGICWRSRRLEREIKTITDNYRTTTEDAKSKFKQNINSLFDFAISAANEAYFKCAGKDPPSDGRQKELFVNNVCAIVFSADVSQSQIATEVPFDIPEKYIVKRLIAAIVRLYKRIKRHTVSVSGKCRRAYRTYRA